MKTELYIVCVLCTASLAAAVSYRPPGVSVSAVENATCPLNSDLEAIRTTITGNLVDPLLTVVANRTGTDTDDIGGSVYIRWGKTTCPFTPLTQLIYQGRAAGSHHSHQGGGSDILCMPENPEYLDFFEDVQGNSGVYGVEYWSYLGQPLGSVFQENIPCAVCSGTKSTILMIPAKVTCPTQWRREYYGYLMAPHSTGNYRSSFICVDKAPEVVPGEAADTDSCDVVHVEATCEGLSCSSYDPEKELTCVVCTL